MSGQGQFAGQDRGFPTGVAEMTRDKVVRETNQSRPQEMEEAATTTHP